MTLEHHSRPGRRFHGVQQGVASAHHMEGKLAIDLEVEGIRRLLEGRWPAVRP
jgi:hypothetical protein